MSNKLMERYLFNSYKLTQNFKGFTGNRIKNQLLKTTFKFLFSFKGSLFSFLIFKELKSP